VVICYRVTFIPNKGPPNLVGELQLWPSAIRRRFYQTRGRQTWPENSSCGHLLSGDAYAKQEFTKPGRRTRAVTNIDSGDVSTKQAVAKLGRRTPAMTEYYQVNVLDQ
jgi:hypothetical protein